MSRYSVATPYRSFAAGVVLFLVTLTTASGAGVTSWTYMDETKLSWRAYGQATFDEAKKRDIPLFVLVYADWCEWCKKLENETLETPKIMKLLQGKYIPVAINYDKQPKLAKQLGAKLVPTMILMTPGNEKLLRFYGFINIEDLSGTLDQTMVAWRKGELPDKEVEEFGSVETCCPLVAPKEE